MPTLAGRFARSRWQLLQGLPGGLQEQALENHLGELPSLMTTVRVPNSTFDRRHRRLPGRSFADGGAPVNSVVRQLVVSGVTP